MSELSRPNVRSPHRVAEERAAREWIIGRRRRALMPKRLNPFAATVLLALLLASPASAEPLARQDVPKPLQPWIGWALDGFERRACPQLNRQNSSGTRICAWPSDLTLDLDDQGGRFRQRFQLFSASTVELPGDADNWPLDVRAAGKPIPVQDDGRPRVTLPAGEHTVQGSFEWTTLPQVLRIPPRTGLLHLTIRGNPVVTPTADKAGRLRLQKGETEPDDKEENHVRVVVHRRLVDEIPLQLETRIELSVSGEVREALLGRVLPSGFTPMSIEGDLPAELDPNGRLRVQAKPGTWTITVNARHDGPAGKISCPIQAIDAANQGGAWDPEEIWVFDARPNLRRVSIEGGKLVDPSRTTLPDAWRHMPAYLLLPGDNLTLKQETRGDADPAPDALKLVRQLWLDFDGAAFTVKDSLHGEIRRSSRLVARDALELGRVELNGRDQVITRSSETSDGSNDESRRHGNGIGIEIPRGALTVSADSRIENFKDLDAVGWQHDVESLEATLHLPPGWRLFHATGVDRVTRTWLNTWTLLDLFFVFVIATAVLRLHGAIWGALALVALAFSFTESRAPQLAWICVLVAEALVRVGPALGRLFMPVRLGRAAALGALLLIVVPFGIQEVRRGIYPALERGHGGASEALEEKEFSIDLSAPRPEPVAMDEMRRVQPPSRTKALGYVDVEIEGLGSLAPAAAPAVSSSSYSDSSARSANRYAPDPTAAVTTGPGLPNWTWQRVRLAWSGPVDQDQTIRFFLIPPWLTTVLAFLRVALVFLLTGCFLRSALPQTGLGSATAKSLAAILLLPAILLPSNPVAANTEFPPTGMLERLRERLLESPECHPNCASIPRMELHADGERMSLRLEVQVAHASAVPLPGLAGSWSPDLIMLGDGRAPVLYRSQDGPLWLELDEGHHDVLVSGSVFGRTEIELPLPLRPHRTKAAAAGWTLYGLHADGTVESNLRLARIPDEAEPKSAGDGSNPNLELGAQELPAFVRVERRLNLGLEWTVETRVTRLTPADRALLIEIPLLDGEAVTADGVRVEEGNALVSMDPRQATATWTSSLTQSPELRLEATDTGNWIETWHLDVNPAWHLEASGIPPILGSRGGARTRTWRPWPGETVTLAISKPQGIDGRTLTIDRARLTLRPGLRSTLAELILSIRSSRGTDHTVLLPEGATLELVSVGGGRRPVRQEDRAVDVPISPGASRVRIEWKEDRGLLDDWIYHRSDVDLGAPAANAEITIQPSEGRWTLFTRGPRLGPAVLFWSQLLVLVVLAYGLGRITFTPLGMRHWLLLGVGLTQVWLPMASVVVLWLLALGWRRRHGDTLSDRPFDLLQVSLVALSVVALVVLVFSIRQGLLGLPQMQIAGNGSSAQALRWYQDRVPGTFPSAWMLSVPLWMYRAAMLAWALWMASALVSWLGWAWGSLSEGGLWRPLRSPKPSRDLGG